MINNNDVVNVMKMKHNMHEQCLLNNVLHSAYVNEYTISLIYIFGIRYGAFQSKNMPFRVKLFNGD